MGVLAVSLDAAEHEKSNQAAEGPHDGPIDAKLPTTVRVTAEDSSLGGEQSIAAALVEKEVPHRPSHTVWDGVAVGLLRGG